MVVAEQVDGLYIVELATDFLHFDFERSGCLMVVEDNYAAVCADNIVVRIGDVSDSHKLFAGIFGTHTHEAQISPGLPSPRLGRIEEQLAFEPNDHQPILRHYDNVLHCLAGLVNLVVLLQVEQRGALYCPIHSATDDLPFTQLQCLGNAILRRRL